MWKLRLREPAWPNSQWRSWEVASVGLVQAEGARSQAVETQLPVPPPSEGSSIPEGAVPSWDGDKEIVTPRETWQASITGTGIRQRDLVSGKGKNSWHWNWVTKSEADSQKGWPDSWSQLAWGGGGGWGRRGRGQVAPDVGLLPCLQVYALHPWVCYVWSWTRVLLWRERSSCLFYRCANYTFMCFLRGEGEWKLLRVYCYSKTLG